jgi:hypothetical protein
MEIYNNLEFNFYYLDVNNIKQKHFGILANIIGMSRLHEYMVLDGPGHMYFEEDDHKHHYPNVHHSRQLGIHPNLISP